MNIFGIGLPEMAVIAAIGLLVFGPKRLPELGKTLGRTLRGFQSASQEFEQEFRSAIAATEATVAAPSTTADAVAPAASPSTLSPASAPSDGLPAAGSASSVGSPAPSSLEAAAAHPGSPLPDVQDARDGGMAVSGATAQPPAVSVAAASVIAQAADSSPSAADQAAAAPGVGSLPVETVA